MLEAIENLLQEDRPSRRNRRFVRKQRAGRDPLAGRGRRRLAFWKEQALERVSWFKETYVAWTT